MLYLSKGDIEAAVHLEEMVDAMEEAMLVYEGGGFDMPGRMHVDHGGNTMLLMPCFIEGFFATKLVTLFPDNPSAGVPVLNGIVVLNEGRTGMPLAILDGPTLTAMRTAAVVSVSIRHLARPDAKTLGLVGAGVQGYYQAATACAIRDFERVLIYDIDADKARRAASRLGEAVGGPAFEVTESIEKLLEAADVIITATTASEPVLPDDAGKLKGKHIAAIGSYQPHVRELPDAIFRLVDEVFVDTEHALGESGDLIIPVNKGLLDSSRIVTLGKMLEAGQSRDRRDDETTLFKSVGMALFDVCAAALVYKKANERGLGRRMDGQGDGAE